MPSFYLSRTRILLLAAGVTVVSGLASPRLRAQDLTSVANSNMAGVVGLEINPASIVDSRLRMDLLLLAGGLNIQGDYAALNRGKLFSEGTFERPDFAKAATDPSKAWVESLGPGTRSQYANVSFNLAPLGAFMLTLSPKSAIAFSARGRLLASAVDAQPASLRLFLSDFKASDQYGAAITERGALLVQQFYEYGLTYGRVVADRGRHFVKAAARVKFLQGSNGFVFDGDGVTYRQLDETTTRFDGGSRFAYAFNRNFGVPTPLSENGDRIFQFTSQPGVGADLGVIYEFRPRIVDYTYDMDGEQGIPVRDKDKYRVRVGLSLLDLGRITYSNEAVTARYSLGTADTFRYAALASSPAATVDSAFAGRFGRGQREGSYSIGLPTRLSLQADVRITDHWFVNATLVQSLADARTATVIPSTYQLTARYESRVIDVMVPVTFNELGHTALGTALRIGPVIIGSNSLWSSFALQQQSNVTDIYFAVKLPIRYTRPKDRDGDRVSDDKDKCPKEPGTWEFSGCPDSDGDHVADKDDQCPQDPGLPRFGGCPDSDGDGVPDKDDQCPRTPGPQANKGCPEGFIELKKD